MTSVVNRDSPRVQRADRDLRLLTLEAMVEERDMEVSELKRQLEVTVLRLEDIERKDLMREDLDKSRDEKFDLARRVKELEAENARLRKSSDSSRTPAKKDPDQQGPLLERQHAREIAQLQRELRACDAAVSIARAERDALEQRVHQMREDEIELEAKAEGQAVQLRLLQEAVAAGRSREEQQEEELRSALELGKTLQDRILRYQEEFRESEARTVAAKAAVGRARRLDREKLDDMSQDVERKTHEVARAADKLHTTELVLDDQTATIEALEKRFSEMTATPEGQQIAQLTERVKVLEGAREELSLALKAEAQVRLEHEARVKEAEARGVSDHMMKEHMELDHKKHIVVLESQLRVKEAAVRDLERRLKPTEERVLELEKKIRELETAAAVGAEDRKRTLAILEEQWKLEQKAQGLEEKVAELDAALVAAKARVRALEDDVEEKEGLVKGLQDEAAKMHERIKGMEEHAAAAEIEGGKMAGRVKALESDARADAERITSLSEQLSQKTSALDVAQAELDAAALRDAALAGEGATREEREQAAAERAERERAERARLEQDLAAQHALVAQLKDAAVADAEKIAAVERDLRESGRKIAAIEEELRTANIDHDVIVGSLEQKCAGLEARLAYSERQKTEQPAEPPAEEPVPPS